MTRSQRTVFALSCLLISTPGKGSAYIAERRGGLFILVRAFGDASKKINRQTKSSTLSLYPIINAKFGGHRRHTKQFSIMNRGEAEKKIQTLWNQILDLWKDNFDIYELRLRTKLNEKTKIPKLLIDFKKNRVPSQPFEVVFNDGLSLSTKKMSGNEVLREVIMKVGPDKVREMNIHTAAGRNIVEKNLNSPKVYSIYKKISNAEKKEIMRRIFAKAPIAEIIDLDR